MSGLPCRIVMTQIYASISGIQTMENFGLELNMETRNFNWLCLYLSIYQESDNVYLCVSLSLSFYIPSWFGGNVNRCFIKQIVFRKANTPGELDQRTWIGLLEGNGVFHLFFILFYFLFFFSCCIPARQLKWNLDHKKREGKPILSFILYRVSEHLSVVPNFQTLESMQRLNYKIIWGAKNFGCGAKSRRDSCVSCAPLRIFRKLSDILLFSGV